MGKVIIVKQKQETDLKTKKVKEKSFCRNCGNKILKQQTGDGFCCKSCKEEYMIKYQPTFKKKHIINDILPYKSYQDTRTIETINETTNNEK